MNKAWRFLGCCLLTFIFMSSLSLQAQTTEPASAPTAAEAPAVQPAATPSLETANQNTQAVPEPAGEISLKKTFMSRFKTFQIGGIHIYYFIISAFFIILGFIGRRIITFFCVRLAKAFQKAEAFYKEVALNTVTKPLGWMSVLIGFYMALSSLPLGADSLLQNHGCKTIFTIGIVIFVVTCFRLLEKLTTLWYEKAKVADQKGTVDIIPMIRIASRLTLLGIGLVLILDNLGFSVTSLVAGLGIGGLAIALASKDTLDNLFGSIILFFDRPFRVGEVIQMEDVEGSVEEIGIRSTRVRTFTNTLLTIPNSTFTTSKINNITQMQKRRIKMSIGVTYDTPADKIELATARINKIITEDSNLRQDFFVVRLDNFGAYSIDILVVCFTVTADWKEFMAVKETFMLKIMRAFAELGVEFAFPTQTIHLQRNNDSASDAEM